MIKAYYLVTKPGIIMGNVVTTAAGFILASRGHIDWGVFLAALVGVILVVASACVFNNYLDREMDKKMERTKNRPLVTGLITGRNAIFFAVILGAFGVAFLAIFTNTLTAILSVIGFLAYVILYGVCKYRTVYGTIIGSISGALPPVIGYAAASGKLDLAAFILFMIVVFWQMPHFFAIAMYRFDDYFAALIPVLPVKKGIYMTKIHMVLYTIAFIGTTSLLTFFGYTGYAYLVVATLLGGTWLWICKDGFKAEDDKVWARQMFLFSLVVITGLCGALAMDVVSEDSNQILSKQDKNIVPKASQHKF